MPMRITTNEAHFLIKKNIELETLFFRNFFLFGFVFIAFFGARRAYQAAIQETLKRVM